MANATQHSSLPLPSLPRHSREGAYLSYILAAPDFVNQSFRDVFANGLPLLTPLVAMSEGPP